MIDKIAVKSSSQLVVVLMTLLATTSAFAGRYWRGATEDALFSDTENWASDSHSGAGGNSYPGSVGDEGTAYFCKIKNGKCVIDGILPLRLSTA